MKDVFIIIVDVETRISNQDGEGFVHEWGSLDESDRERRACKSLVNLILKRFSDADRFGVLEATLVVAPEEERSDGSVERRGSLHISLREKAPHLDLLPAFEERQTILIDAIEESLALIKRVYLDKVGGDPVGYTHNPALRKPTGHLCSSELEAEVVQTLIPLCRGRKLDLIAGDKRVVCQLPAIDQTRWFPEAETITVLASIRGVILRKEIVTIGFVDRFKAPVEVDCTISEALWRHHGSCSNLLRVLRRIEGMDNPPDVMVTLRGQRRMLYREGVEREKAFILEGVVLDESLLVPQVLDLFEG